MKLKSITIENFRAIEKMELPLHPQLTVLVGDNAAGKTTILDAIATGLGVIPMYLSVKGRGFNHGDIREIIDTQGKKTAPYARITLESTNQLSWAVTKKRQGGTSKIPATPGRKALFTYLENLLQELEEDKPILLPVMAYYGIDRTVPTATFRRNFKKLFTRVQALENALAISQRFTTMMEWFALYEDLERRERERVRDFDYTSPWLNAFRDAVKSMLPTCSNPHTLVHPMRLVVDFQYRNQRAEVLSLDHLSDGYRTTLAVVMDLARRMIQANPHLEEKAVIDSEAVVLIDEIELHLHPQWQQRVLVDLMRTFPKAQFIVATHSPQVLTTIHSQHIVILKREEGITAYSPSASSYGAESGRMLEEIQGVSQRPPAAVNEFSKWLEEYRDLIKRGEGESDQAKEKRLELNRLSPRDPELLAADMEIRRRRVQQRLLQPS